MEASKVVITCGFAAVNSRHFSFHVIVLPPNAVSGSSDRVVDCRIPRMVQVELGLY